MTLDESLQKIAKLERRLVREKLARNEAELILEQKSQALYDANQNLTVAFTNLEKLSMAVEQSPVIVLISDVVGIVEYVNRSFELISEYTKHEVIGKDLRHLGLLIDKKPLDGIKHVMTQKTLWRGDIQGISKSKQQYTLAISISPILDKNNTISHFLYSCEDVTKQKQDEEKIYALAHYDSLTGLYNRFSIDGILQQAISSAERNNTMLSVLFIDMDRFKQINDTYGHIFGDELLKQVANRLNVICRRKNDYLARIGGDEFLVLLTDTEGTTYTALTASAIVETLSFPYSYNGEELISSPSVGIAIYPDDGLNSSDLIKNADAAMYHVKNNGRQTYSFFTKELNQQIQEKNALEVELRLALDRGDFELYYQPQIYLQEDNVIGVEALLRWNHATLGFISPEKFIAIAEERGLIYALGLWVIETAFIQLQAWTPHSNISIKMAINLSANQIEDNRFIPDLTLLLNKHQIDATMVELEVTESIAMKDPQKSINTLSELRALGFEIAIDDFGTGYSSLAYLKILPIQTLKLDKSFIDNLETDPNNAKICKAAISLSHDLGLRFVAEGVETQAQSAFLIDNKCDVLQGYYYSRPVPAAQAFVFIQQFYNSEK